MTNCNYSEHTKIQRKEIQKQIEELQEKLRKLEEQDPEMLLLRQGKVDFVDYDGKKYFRIEYTDSFAGEYSWYVRRIGEDAIRPVRDVNVYASLEELYQKEVVKQKDDYPYKKYTPEETEQSLKEAFREAVKQGIIHEVDKVSDVFMNEMVAKLKGQTLTDIIWNWWGNVFTSNEDWDAENAIEHLVDLIEAFLPKSQNAAGSQNAYVESAVEGFNDCLDKIKRKLR